MRSRTRHLLEIGAACADLPLITGGSGIALGLPENFRRRGLLQPRADAEATARRRRHCRRACRQLLGRDARPDRGVWPSAHPAFAARSAGDRRGPDVGRRSARLGRAEARGGPVLIYASAPPDEVRGDPGQARAASAPATLVEEALADIAARPGRDAACGGWWWRAARPPARWCSARRDRAAHRPADRSRRALDRRASGEPRLALALKSGNFGSAGLLREGPGGMRAMTTEATLREAIVPLGKSIFERGLTSAAPATSARGSRTAG